MKLLQKLWNYLPALFKPGVLEGHMADHAEHEDYKDYTERKGYVGVCAPCLAEPSSCVDCTALGTTARPEFWIE
jgi:hypothetical protein